MTRRFTYGRRKVHNHRCAGRYAGVRSLDVGSHSPRREARLRD
ncbi:hypothetical protein CPL00374_CDS0036 [Klebsiella phage Keithsmous]|uniref:Uncharacterized protein n=1 Tax=Klebsiella phage Keithsmous TaxID=3098263 RepID=A0ABZ2EPZ9_9CAUD